MCKFKVILFILVACFLFTGCSLSISEKPHDMKEEIIKSLDNTAALNVSMDESNYDIVVIGSELEGIYLAKAAFDKGLKVLVLDPREKAGGQLIQGEMLFLDEPRDLKGNSLLQGSIIDLFKGFKSGKLRKKNEFENYFRELTDGISMQNGVKINDLNINQINGLDQIESLLYQDRQGITKKVHATYWVENTDFNALLSKLNVKRIPGIETIYREPQIDYMAATMMMKFRNVDWEAQRKSFNSVSTEERRNKFGTNTFVNDTFVTGFGNILKKYKASTDDLFLRGFNGINQRDGEVIVNALLTFNVDPSKDESINIALEKARNEMPSILAFLRKNMIGWENAELNGFPEYLYIREFNRYETDYVLQKSDLMNSKMFWDNVSIGGYPIDMQGTKANVWGIELGHPDKYGIPLRSFLLKNYDNVLVAGKNIGASEDAYGSVRIQANTSLAAQNIGLIIGEIHNKKRLRDLNETDFKTLHEYLWKTHKINVVK